MTVLFFTVSHRGSISLSVSARLNSCQIARKLQGFSHGSHLVLVVLLSLCLLQGIVPQLQPVYFSNMYEENKAPRDFESGIGPLFHDFKKNYI